MISGFLSSTWGYCPRCEHWHYSGRWLDQSGQAACPHCGAAPSVIETIDRDRGRMRLDLEVATGPVGRRRFFD